MLDAELVNRNIYILPTETYTYYQQKHIHTTNRNTLKNKTIE